MSKAKKSEVKGHGMKVLERAGLSQMLSGVFKVQSDKVVDFQKEVFWRHEYLRVPPVPGKTKVAYDDYPADRFKDIAAFAAAMETRNS
tara:strand:+ start:610 stop:873 length:264 start_codon:yes stop_codon:yes gene_type:complete